MSSKPWMREAHLPRPLGSSLPQARRLLASAATVQPQALERNPRRESMSGPPKRLSADTSLILALSSLMQFPGWVIVYFSSARSVVLDAHARRQLAEFVPSRRLIVNKLAAQDRHVLRRIDPQRNATG